MIGVTAAHQSTAGFGRGGQVGRVADCKQSPLFQVLASLSTAKYDAKDKQLAFLADTQYKSMSS